MADIRVTQAPILTLDVSNKSARVTQAPVLVVDTSNKGIRVTQAPVLVVDTSNKGIRVTQAPVLVVSVPTYPVRITQSPILAAYEPRPIRFPRVYVPDMPVNETIEYYTTVSRSYNGSEQRNKLRNNPRVTLNLLLIAETPVERHDLLYFVQKYTKDKVDYPYYHYSTVVTTPAVIGSSRINFDTSRITIQDNGTIALFDPQLEVTHYVEVATVDGTGVDLAEPLAFNVGMNWRVCAVGTFRIISGATVVMHHVHGTVNITLGTTKCIVSGGNNPAVLTMYNNVPVSPLRHNAPADEIYTWNARLLDNGIGPYGSYIGQDYISLFGTREFTINRIEDMNMLRKFIDAIGGMHRPFYMPTYFDDLTLAAPAVSGSATIRVNQIDYSEMWKGVAWRGLRIETAAGVKYRDAKDVRLIYDANGDAYALDIVLSSALGNTPQDIDVRKISYMPLCRLDDDKIELTHYAHSTDVKLKISAVKA